MIDALFHNIYIAPDIARQSRWLKGPVAVLPGPENTLVIHRALEQGWAFAGRINHVWWAGDVALVQARHALYLLRSEIIPRPTITAHEQAILRGLAAGSSTQAIGQQVHLAESTIQQYTARLLARLGAKHRAHLIAIAKDQGLI